MSPAFKRRRRRICAWCQRLKAETQMTCSIGAEAPREYALHGECKKEMASWLSFRREAEA